MEKPWLQWLTQDFYRIGDLQNIMNKVIDHYISLDVIDLDDIIKFIKNGNLAID